MDFLLCLEDGLHRLLRLLKELGVVGVCVVNGLQRPPDHVPVVQLGVGHVLEQLVAAHPLVVHVFGKGPIGAHERRRAVQGFDDGAAHGPIDHPLGARLQFGNLRHGACALARRLYGSAHVQGFLEKNTKSKTLARVGLKLHHELHGHEPTHLSRRVGRGDGEAVNWLIQAIDLAARVLPGLHEVAEALDGLLVVQQRRKADHVRRLVRVDILLARRVQEVVEVAEVLEAGGQVRHGRVRESHLRAAHGHRVGHALGVRLVDECGLLRGRRPERHHAVRVRRKVLGRRARLRDRVRVRHLGKAQVRRRVTQLPKRRVGEERRFERESQLHEAVVERMRAVDAYVERLGRPRDVGRHGLGDLLVADEKLLELGAHGRVVRVQRRLGKRGALARERLQRRNRVADVGRYHALVRLEALALLLGHLRDQVARVQRVEARRGHGVRERGLDDGRARDRRQRAALERREDARLGYREHDRVPRHRRRLLVGRGGVPRVRRQHRGAVYVVRAERVGHCAQVREPGHVDVRVLVELRGVAHHRDLLLTRAVAIVRGRGEDARRLGGPALRLHHGDAVGCDDGRAVDAVGHGERRERAQRVRDVLGVLHRLRKRRCGQVGQQLLVGVRALALKLERRGHDRLECLGGRARWRVVDLAREAVVGPVEAVGLARDRLGERRARPKGHRLGLLPRHVVDGLEHGLDRLHAHPELAGREEGDVDGRLDAVLVHGEHDGRVDADGGVDRVPVGVLDWDLRKGWRGHTHHLLDVAPGAFHESGRVHRGEERVQRHRRRARHGVDERAVDRRPRSQAREQQLCPVGEQQHGHGAVHLELRAARLLGEQRLRGLHERVGERDLDELVPLREQVRRRAVRVGECKVGLSARRRATQRATPREKIALQVGLEL